MVQVTVDQLWRLYGEAQAQLKVLEAQYAALVVKVRELEKEVPTEKAKGSQKAARQ